MMTSETNYTDRLEAYSQYKGVKVFYFDSSLPYTALYKAAFLRYSIANNLSKAICLLKETNGFADIVEQIQNAIRILLCDADSVMHLLNRKQVFSRDDNK